MNALELLIAARAKIDTPEKWGKGGAYLNAQGQGVRYPDRACAFCSVGAIWATSLGEDDKIKLDAEAEEALALAINPGVKLDISYWDYWDHVTMFNDNPETTHEEVMAVFDRAIASLKGE